MTWREVIHHYLTACVEDAREGLSRAAKNRERMCIEEYGTKSLSERHARMIQSLVLRHGAPLNPPVGYQVVEERSDLVIVEVEPAPNGHPCVQTRFRLMRRDESWALDDIFWKCHCPGGKCSLCDGTGTCRICNGKGALRTFWGLVRRECMLCRGEAICRYCKGTGQCSFCKESDMSGWITTIREYSVPSEGSPQPNDA